MSGFPVAGALAAWRGSLSGMAVLAVVTLAGSYVTGFSIGGLYFPGALALALAPGWPASKLWASGFAAHAPSVDLSHPPG